MNISLFKEKFDVPYFSPFTDQELKAFKDQLESISNWESTRSTGLVIGGLNFQAISTVSTVLQQYCMLPNIVAAEYYRKLLSQFYENRAEYSKVFDNNVQNLINNSTMITEIGGEQLDNRVDFVGALIDYAYKTGRIFIGTVVCTTGEFAARYGSYRLDKLKRSCTFVSFDKEK